MNKSAILIKSLEHGQKVKKWLESIGVDCSEASLDNTGAVYCIDNNKCFWSYNNHYNKFPEIFLPAEETLVSKLRNVLTPCYSMPRVVDAYLIAKPTPELRQMLIDLIIQAKKNESIIHELLTKLADLEDKQSK